MGSKQALVEWLATVAPAVPYGEEWWAHADPALCPLSERTFWRHLKIICEEYGLRRVHTRIGTRRGGRGAVLVRGEVGKVGKVGRQIPAFGKVECTPKRIHVRDFGKVGKVASISINGGSPTPIQSSLNSSLFASLTRERDSEVESEKSSGQKEMKDETVEQKKQKWGLQQGKDPNGIMAEQIKELIDGRQTKKKLADLWKLLFAYHGHGYARALNYKEQACLLCWNEEFFQNFGGDFKIGEFLQDLFEKYDACREYILGRTSWSKAPEKPDLNWLYFNRNHAVDWWMEAGKSQASMRRSTFASAPAFRTRPC
jgi:hypothetical protein